MAPPRVGPEGGLLVDGEKLACDTPVGTCPADEGSWLSMGDGSAVFEGMRRFCGGGTPCRERWKAFILAATSCGRPPALAAANEDGGGPGLLAALIAPKGLDGAFVLGNAGDSVIERYDGGRTLGEGANDGAKSEVLTEADSSREEGTCEAFDSRDVGVLGGELMTDVWRA